MGKIGVWADLITPYQYNQALTKQKSYLSRDKEAPPLGQVMVEAKMLSETAVAAILGVLARRRPDPDDTDFGQIAVQNKLVDKERIDECTKLQTDYALEHNEVPPLGVMLFEKRCLQENQTIAIYKAQERKGRGLLRDIKTAIEENREETLLERIYPKDDPVRQKQVIVGGILGFIILLIWGKFLFFSGGAVKIDTYCNACQRVAKAKWSGEELPMKCKLCGKKEAFAALKCRRDGEVFGVNDPFTPGSRCPKCGGTNARPPSETD
ncbi:MAG: hypothetical protein FJ272_23040 [Planctomycetes bacterium]|nr:hypothetical protein [Planctomycetota bacterium]